MTMENGEPSFDADLDCAGLFCPMPVINAQKELEKMQKGQTLKVVATDPGVLSDFPLFCKSRKMNLLKISEIADEFWIYIRK